MKISNLTVGQGNVEVIGTIKDIGDTRTFNKYGRNLSVANAILEDDSGSIKLTLWNDDVTRFKDGDKIKVVNGYVNEFQGEKQLTSGKFGSLEKIESEINEDKGVSDFKDKPDNQEELDKNSEESSETEEEFF